VICGAGGNDTISGAGGDDVLLGGPGRDKLTGGPGKDRLDGGAGRDVLSAEDGNKDILVGGPGVDRVRGDRQDKAITTELGFPSSRTARGASLANGEYVGCRYRFLSTGSVQVFPNGELPNEYFTRSDYIYYWDGSRWVYANNSEWTQPVTLGNSGTILLGSNWNLGPGYYAVVTYIYRYRGAELTGNGYSRIGRLHSGELMDQYLGYTFFDRERLAWCWTP
jgi:Ca2+-binding RTX toxin-like protein